MSDKPNIYQRINAVMQEVTYVQKDAEIQGYKAVTHDQLVSVARKAFVQQGIVIELDQIDGHLDDSVNGAKVRMYHGTYEVRLVNMDNPEDRVCVQVHAHALDNGDKAPGKCATYATKTAIIKLLWLETGENDESRAEMRNPELITEQEAQEIWPLIVTQDNQGNMSWTQKGGKLAAAYNFSGPDQIRKKDLPKIREVLGL